MADEVTREDILKDLTAKSIALWGQARTEKLESAMEQTATYLWEISGQTWEPPWNPVSTSRAACVALRL